MPDSENRQVSEARDERKTADSRSRDRRNMLKTMGVFAAHTTSVVATVLKAGEGLAASPEPPFSPP